MKLQVMDRSEAVRFSHGPSHGVNAAMISISTPGTNYHGRPGTRTAVRRICRTEFADTVRTHDPWAIDGPTANGIARFAIACRNGGVDLLVVHCDAGMSRSAAVAKAIAEHFGIHNEDVSYKPGSTPNPTVYDAVLKALACADAVRAVRKED